ncbi:MAG: Spy/CpxP family protein refolding chaperone [Dictyoglomaceae bacterium]
MSRTKILLSFILAILLLFSLTYAFSRDRFQDRLNRLRVRVIRPLVPEKPSYFSEELRKLIMERNKLWFELRELLRNKQLNLSKIEEKAKELQRVEEEISKKTQLSFLERLSKNLNLTKDQESSVKKILESYNDKLEALRKDLKEKNIELKNIDPKDKEKISAKKKEIAEILRKLSDTRKQLIEEIKKVLSEEQKKKLDKYFKFRFHSWGKL